ncbi:MAG: FGGY family carbohydrate kinase [Gaiellaceae bacterium]
MGIDQGTTGTTCLVVDDDLQIVGRGYARVHVTTPQPGWVEQDPRELWSSVEAAAEAALASCGATMRDVDAVGIANQRETTVVWDRRTGEPVHPAIVWQDRRTAARCRELPAELIRARTGLTPDPYFSATKLEWILREHRDGVAFGTVDTWLLWQLTNGAVHWTDPSNASRTMLLDLAALQWDGELLDLFDVPRETLPEVRTEIDVEGVLLGEPVRIRALAGDQQASLYAHGAAKATIGTGAFVLVPTGGDCSPAPHGLIRTAAAGDGYALEGSVFVATAALEWLRDVAGVDPFTVGVDSTEGVYFVPALTGLGSPHWAPDARAVVTGLSRTTRREHVVRAALESIAYQVLDVVEAMPDRPELLRADGGASANAFLMQFLADVLRLPVEASAEPEMTALGAAALAARLPAPRQTAARYEPELDVSGLVAGWRTAVTLAVS